MEFKLPENLASVSLDGVEYTPDAGGVIVVPDHLADDVTRDFGPHGVIPFSSASIAQAEAEAVERQALYAKLAEYGIPVDKRRRPSMETLREMVGTAELTRAVLAKQSGEPAPAPQEAGAQQGGAGQA